MVSRETSQVRTADLEVSSLEPNPYQPRRHFDPQALQALSSSIVHNGLIQPAVVRPAGSGRFEIIAGERRWRACALAGLQKIRCEIREASDEQMALVALAENLERNDLNAIEHAQALARLMTEFGFTHQKIGAEMHCTRSAVTNTLRLLELPKEVQQLVVVGRLAPTVARTILAFPVASRVPVARMAAEKGWTRRQLERHAGTQFSVTAQGPADPNVAALERDLTARVGSRVHIEHDSQGHPSVRIECVTNDVMDGVIEILTRGSQHDRAGN